jgi:hypothetical protein
MNAAPTASDVSQESKRRLRLIVETYYDVQGVRIETEHRIRQYAEHEGLIAVVGNEKTDLLRREGMEAYRKGVRNAKEDPAFLAAFETAVHRLEDEEHHRKVNDLMRQQETILKRQAMHEVSDHPLWTTWLSRVYGIGPCLAGGLIAWLDPYRWRHESELWRYMGLAVVVDGWKCYACKHDLEHHPSLVTRERPQPLCPKCGNAMAAVGHAERREKGQKMKYNPKCKVLAFKIGESFVRCSAAKSGYRKLYDSFRKKLETAPCNKVHKDEKGNPIPCFDAHRHAKAKRLVVKIFVAHVYQVWRKLLGLPVSKPYVYSQGVPPVPAGDERNPFRFWSGGHDPEAMIQPIYDVKDGDAVKEE